MSCLICMCGNRIDWSGFPNKNIGWMIFEEDFDAIEDPFTREKVASLLVSQLKFAYCPKCERIMKFSPHDKKTVFYKIDKK